MWRNCGGNVGVALAAVLAEIMQQTFSSSTCFRLTLQAGRMVNTRDRGIGQTSSPSDSYLFTAHLHYHISPPHPSPPSHGHLLTEHDTELAAIRPRRTMAGPLSAHVHPLRTPLRTAHIHPNR